MHPRNRYRLAPGLSEAQIIFLSGMAPWTDLRSMPLASVYPLIRLGLVEVYQPLLEARRSERFRLTAKGRRLVGRLYCPVCVGPSLA